MSTCEEIKESIRKLYEEMEESIGRVNKTFKESENGTFEEYQLSALMSNGFEIFELAREASLEIDKSRLDENLISIDTRGTQFIYVKYNPITTEVTTMVKRGTIHDLVQPDRRSFKEFCNEYYVLEQFSPGEEKEHLKIINRIKLN